jgi:hypothetical protein
MSNLSTEKAEQEGHKYKVTLGYNSETFSQTKYVNFSRKT